MPWLFPILAYLVGSIPFGVLIARSRGIDIRAHGSGNVGATNVFRVVGKKFGVACLLLDFLKGFIPVALASNLLRITGEAPAVPIPVLWDLGSELPPGQQLHFHSVHVITALAAIMGHNYSFVLRGRGGKGIATSAGALVALMPLVLLGAFLVFAVTFFFSRYVSLGSILGALSLPAFCHALDRVRHVDGDGAESTLWEAGAWNKPLLFFALVTAALAVWRHRPNIKRMLAGTEQQLTSRPPNSPASGPDSLPDRSNHES